MESYLDGHESHAFEDGHETTGRQTSAVTLKRTFVHDKTDKSRADECSVDSRGNGR